MEGSGAENKERLSGKVCKACNFRKYRSGLKGLKKRSAQLIQGF